MTTNLDKLNALTPEQWEQVISERTERILLIKQIFGYDKFLGVDVKELQTNKYYYNDFFNQLWDMTTEELRWWEDKLGLEVANYQSIITNYIEHEN